MNLEILKIIISTITPFLVFIFGLILLRKSENIKSEVSRLSGFSQKWTDEFFQSYKLYLGNIEDVLTLLFHLQEANEEKVAIVKDLNRALIDFSKYQLHIELLLSTFPEITECNEIKQSMEKILSLLQNMIKTKKGNLDDMKNEISNFNILAKKVHSKSLES